MTSGAEADRLPVGDLVIGVDGRAVGGVVPERRLVTNEFAARVAHHPIAAAMAGGEGDARLRVDESEGADIGALQNLHPREDHHTRVGLRRCAREGERDERSRRRCKYV